MSKLQPIALKFGVSPKITNSSHFKIQYNSVTFRPGATVSVPIICGNEWSNVTPLWLIVSHFNKLSFNWIFVLLDVMSPRPNFSDIYRLKCEISSGVCGSVDTIETEKLQNLSWSLVVRTRCGTPSDNYRRLTFKLHRSARLILMLCLLGR